MAIKNIQINFFDGGESILDSISNTILNISKKNILYNDLLDMQSLILTFGDNREILDKFSKSQLLIFQNKRIQAIDELINGHVGQFNKLLNNDDIYDYKGILLKIKIARMIVKLK